MEEAWRPIHSLNDLYEVSSLGRVRSTSRTIAYDRRGDMCSRRHGGRLLKVSPRSGGYLGLAVSCTYPQKLKYVFVHRLVAEAFLDGFYPGCGVVHINGDHADNRVENLTITASGRGTSPDTAYLRSLPVIDTATGITYMNYLDAEKSLGLKNVLRCMRAHQKCNGVMLEFVH